MLLTFSQPVNCMFWPIETLNWRVAASKVHKHRGACYTAEMLWRHAGLQGFTCGQRCQFLNSNHSHTCFQSKNIIASSPDKYMSPLLLRYLSYLASNLHRNKGNCELLGDPSSYLLFCSFSFPCFRIIFFSCGKMHVSTFFHFPSFLFS